MKSNLLFYLAISLLFTHELDAVTHAEWQLLYLLRDLNYDTAYPVFVTLHIVFFMVVFVLIHHDNEKIQTWFKNGACVFMIIHSIIHFNLIGSQAYTFESLLSNTLIFGSAVLGSIYLLFFGIKKTV